MRKTTPGDHFPSMLRMWRDDTRTQPEPDMHRLRSGFTRTRSSEVASPALPAYPLDTRALQSATHCLYTGFEEAWHCLDRACTALAHWNDYLARHNERDAAAFLDDTRWLVTTEVSVGHEMGGWPVRVMPVVGAGRCMAQGVVVLSARVQGLALGTLQRAYYLTGDDAFRLCAARAFRTFEHDLL